MKTATKHKINLEAFTRLADAPQKAAEDGTKPAMTRSQAFQEILAATPAKPLAYERAKMLTEIAYEGDGDCPPEKVLAEGVEEGYVKPPAHHASMGSGYEPPASL